MQSKNLVVYIKGGENNATQFPERDGYVWIPDNTTYSIEIQNNSNSNGDAKISIDGTTIGTFRIAANRKTIISRSVNSDKSFVFRSEEQLKAITPDLIGKNHNGLVVVCWEQERPFQQPVPFSSNMSLCSGGSSGLTILGPPTGQQFTRTAPITNVDTDKSTRISLRLVIPDESVEPLQTSLIADPPRLD